MDTMVVGIGYMGRWSMGMGTSFTTHAQSQLCTLSASADHCVRL